MEIPGLNTANKLILLFVFDKMDMPITDATVVELCTIRKNWLNFIDCKDALSQLIDSGFLFENKNDAETSYYTLTPDGRNCISLFYNKISSKLRSEITNYIRENRMQLRRNQEYLRKYDKNPDGTYTVTLKIVDAVQTTLEIKLNTPNLKAATQAVDRWEEKAANVFMHLHEQLLE